ncbi:MAG TPA: GMC family oxidoreductase N-terminal domain-containing protein [Roseomonas sp.]|nr:GMC family oxidoreductase N-terminal domain-containing protein [Roseomonas sp.]
MGETLQFDVVILGGGSAGCVLAARLSEDPHRRVLLVEAGRDLRPGAMPRDIASPYPGRAYFNPANTWPGLRVSMGRDPGNTGDATIRPYEQARLLGGGSSINGIGANRGSPHDYAEWVAEGAAGWGWDEVLPYFRKLETDLDLAADTALHGAEGPLPIQRVPRRLHTPFAKHVEAELLRQGFAAREDQNGVWEDGVYPITVNLDREGARTSTATVYLTEAVRRRSNLTLWTETEAERLLFEGRRATGARLLREGQSVSVAAPLVIVSAGALHSPALLMRSGIGPGRALGALGIPVVAGREGVGRNLLEHPSIGMSAFIRADARLPAGDRYHIQSILRWSSGMAGTPPGDMHTAVNTRSGWHAVGHRIATLFSWVNKSYSQGVVTLASADFRDSPQVDFRMLSDGRDLERLAQAFRLAAGVLRAPSMQGMVVEAFPSTYSAQVKKLLALSRRNGLLTALAGPAMDRSPSIRRRILAMAQEGIAPLEVLCTDEEALRMHLRKHVGGVWHPCGTCRLGAADDPMAVCDPEGRVIGTEGLMVCDASLMPTIPCANLNVPVIMIAEKLADAVKARDKAAPAEAVGQAA